MSTETSSLLAGAAQSSYTVDREGARSHERIALSAGSTTLLDWLRAGSPESSKPSIADPRAILPIHLYALHVLSQPSARTSRTSIRAILSHDAVQERLKVYLNDAIENLLDANLAPSGSGVEGTVEGDDMEEIMWEEWVIDEGGKRSSGSLHSTLF
jgi:hypothetical protein